MQTSYSTLHSVAKGKDKWGRADAAKLVSAYEARGKTVSRRDFSQEAGVPRSALLHWLDRKSNIDADPVLVDFLESPAGIAFLHRLITAAHIAFTKDGTASIHNVVDFLEKSGLSPFVASSYSSQRKVSEQLDKSIIEFGENEGKRLAQQMPRKQITLCEDETFHPETCLVAIEPVSNFILVEKYAADRKTKTWDEAVSDGLEKLPVEVIQVAGDEGRSLISHALKGLKVHHSPDCFHVIYEIGRGTCGALMSKIRKAENEHEKAVKETLSIEREKEKFDTAEKHPRGRRPHFEQRIEQAEREEEQAKSEISCLGQCGRTYNQAPFFHSRRCRHISDRMTPPATEILRDSTPPGDGMRTSLWHRLRTDGLSPRCSLPRTSTSGLFQSKS